MGNNEGMKKIKIGAHVSTSGGILKSIQRAKEIGAECMQIFAGSPKRYEVAKITEEEGGFFYNKTKLEGVLPIYIHASYLLNLASEDSVLVEKSKKNLSEAMIYSSKIGSSGVIYHPGSPKGGLKEDAIEREVAGILNVLEMTPENTFLLIENTAGKKKIGTDPVEIGLILKKVSSERLRVCIDTAHSFESGNIVAFDEESILNWLDWWDREVGLENVGVFHVNDSLTKANSQHDRHANIGEGYIGIDGFKNLMKSKKIENIPWILEVPGFDGLGPDKKNIDIVKGIRSSF